MLSSCHPSPLLSVCSRWLLGPAEVLDPEKQGRGGGQRSSAGVRVTHLHTGHRQVPLSQFSCRYDSRSKHCGGRQTDRQTDGQTEEVRALRNCFDATLLLLRPYEGLPPGREALWRGPGLAGGWGYFSDPHTPPPSPPHTPPCAYILPGSPAATPHWSCP